MTVNLYHCLMYISIIALLTFWYPSDSLFDVARLNDFTQALWLRSLGSSFWVSGVSWAVTAHEDEAAEVPQ